MAVYTEVSGADIGGFLTEYDIGRVISFKGIAEGVENSNYFLLTDQRSFIVTLYEKRVSVEDLPFFLGLMEHLAAHGVVCPTPISGRDGAVLRTLCGRPAAIIGFLKGISPRRIHADHCPALGAAMAEMHLAGDGFALRRSNALSIAGWRSLFDSCRAGADQVSPGLEAIIDAELAHLESHWPEDLPAGVIHADLFPDNVFFDGTRLSGLIDFYFACNDFFAYDTAICLNAWCFERDGSFNRTKGRQLLVSYGRVRPFSGAEIAALPLLARGASLRFMLTRLYDRLNRVEGALVKPKDPLEYLQKLRFHQAVSSSAEYGLL